MISTDPYTFLLLHEATALVFVQWGSLELIARSSAIRGVQVTGIGQHKHCSWSVGQQVMRTLLNTS